MKTNVIMKRQLDCFDVLQRTSDGYFNASELLRQWNKIKGNTRRDLDKFLNSPSTKEFLEALSNELKISNLNVSVSESSISQIIEMPDYQVVKETKTKVQAGAGFSWQKNVWVHPYLFIDFAMWINPKFKVKVIKFVYDELIKNRHEAGDCYAPFTSAISKLEGVDFAYAAKALNFNVFGKHYKGIRNTATQEQLKELYELEKYMADYIEDTGIKTFEEMLNVLRKKFVKKYYNF